MATRKLLKKTTRRTAAHLSVGAKAGVGKTTTSVWALAGVPAGITLSDEQKPIIESIQSEKAASVRFTAFSKAIQTEAESRLPPGVECCTNHSLGLRTIKNNCGTRVRVDGNKTFRQYLDLYGDPKTAKNRKEAYELLNETKSIVSIAKSTLSCDLNESQEQGEFITTPERLAATCDFYSVNHSPASLQKATEVLRDGSRRTDWVDFDDMVSLPAVLGLSPEKVALGIVDECQDLNAAQLWLASHSCDRLVTIGDENQSIFGFAGADPQAISRIEDWMEDTSRGMQQLPLNETRRCAKAIVAECQREVPEFRAHPSNPEGIVRDLKSSKLMTELTEDFLEKKNLMVLCRTNAPLTSLALQLLKNRLPVYIRGRQFAQGIISQIKKLAAPYEKVTKLLGELEAYEQLELSKLVDSTRLDKDQKIVDLHDRCEIIRIFCDGCTDVQCVLSRFDELFSDENKKNAICLTSVHRSKGLEADKILIVRPELLPHAKIAEKSQFNAIQERNLSYVGKSRAINELVYVTTE